MNECRLTQTTVHQQREEALALKEMIRSAQNTPKNSSRQSPPFSFDDAIQKTNSNGSISYTSSLNKLPDIVENNALYEPDEYDDRSSGGINIISSESLSRKIMKKPSASDTNVSEKFTNDDSPTGSVATTATIDTTSSGVSLKISGKSESVLIKEYFEQRIDATDHTPLVSARRQTGEVPTRSPTRSPLKGASSGKLV